jgi:PAS domain S-box-containing protein
MNTRPLPDNRRSPGSLWDWIATRFFIRIPIRIKWRDVLLFALYEATFYIAYGYGMSFSQTTASPFWFPDSVLLCALLLCPPRRWWILLLGPLPIRLFADVAVDTPMWFLLTTTAIDAAKGLMAATLLRRLVKHPAKLETIYDFGVFSAVAVLLVPSLSAFVGAAARSALGHDYWLAWGQWFFGDATTQMIITPALLFMIAGARWNFGTVSKLRWLEAGVLTIGLIISAYFATTANSSSAAFMESRFYMPIPFLFWAAVRFGMAGASGAIAVFAAFAIETAIQGRGPFSGLSPTDVALVLQNFLLLRTVPVYFVAVSIEQRRRIERSLTESEQRFRSVANTAPVLIWQSDPDKLCEFVNHSWLKFTGRTLNQELGKGWAQGIHPDDLAHCFDVFNKSFEAQKPFETEYRLRRHDGDYRWVLDTGAPRYSSSGDFIGYIGSAIDITDRKQSEASNRRLEHAQRLAIMGELTAIIAHEVRQPISAILSNADAAAMLLRSENPPLHKLRDIIADIRNCDLRAEETITRIRGFMRNRETAMQPLDLNAAVTEAVQLIRTDARRRRTDIRCELTPHLPLVTGDQTHLQHVLLNLLVNALDAMESTASAREIVVTTVLAQDAVRVTVKDRGCGIPTDRLPKLFDSFYTTRKEGMGLGLSIARSIVIAHNGRIWAENNSTGGASFYFTIPCVKQTLGPEQQIEPIADP